MNSLKIVTTFSSSLSIFPLLSRILTCIVFTVEKLSKKSLRCKYNFVKYHLEKRSVSTAIRYKKGGQIFVVDGNKSPIRYIFRDATKSYTVWCEHSLKYPNRLMIVPININSLHNKFDSLALMLDNYLDILLISETTVIPHFLLRSFK